MVVNNNIVLRRTIRNKRETVFRKTKIQNKQKLEVNRELKTVISDSRKGEGNLQFLKCVDCVLKFPCD